MSRRPRLDKVIVAIALLLAASSVVVFAGWVGREQVIISDASAFEVEARNYRYKQFIVESDWRNPRLCYEVTVMQGKDVDIVVLKEGREIFKRRITGYERNTVSLPGPGPYEVRLSNEFSWITDKVVRAKVVLQYEVWVEEPPRTTQNQDTG